MTTSLQRSILKIKKTEQFIFVYLVTYTVKKGWGEGGAVFPSPVGMSFTKLFLARNYSIIPGQGEFGK